MRNKAKKQNKTFFFILLIPLIVILLIFFLARGNIAILNPKGVIAAQEKNLVITALLLMLVAVLPALILASIIVLRNRNGDKKKEKEFSDKTSRKLQITWWALPSTIVLLLALLTWKTSHAVDPYKQLNSSVAPIDIQVVALRWKWLFIYPKQNIATVNFIQIPQNTPIHFDLTADAPMNSFWIPQLGGQMYAMAGMSTQLNLMANQEGEFNGSAAEINGAGFAGMKFITKSSSQADFNTWVETIKQSHSTLTFDDYNNELELPSENNPRVFYSSVESDLYHKIISKFMPASTGSNSQDVMQMPGMNMQY
jgi:cytochrome o ubiquinol oxidase subunit 2